MTHTPTDNQKHFAQYLCDIYADDRWDEQMTFDEFLNTQLDCLDAPYEEVMLEGFDSRSEAKDAMIKLSRQIHNG